jgi:RimJ/RimL family protein N-acetyltransferase
MSGNTPTVLCARIVLRSFRKEDAPELHRILCEPGVMRYFPRTDPPALDAVERLIARQLAHWKERGYGWWAVELPGVAPLLGWCGLQYLPETGETEVAYLLDKAHWRKGYATEGARASLEFGFGKHSLDRIIGLTHPRNKASQRVLLKLGMVLEGEFTYFGMLCRRYALLRERFAG